MVNELEKKYNTKIKTAINNNNPYTQVQDLTPKKTSLSTNVNPYNQQSNQLLKPLPKVDFEPLNKLIKSGQEQIKYLGDVGTQAGRQTLRTLQNIPSAITYSQSKPIAEKDFQVGFTDVPKDTKGDYELVASGNKEQYKAVKDSMESQYDYANMPETTKKAYEEVVKTLLAQETYGKSFEEQRQVVRSLYENKEIPYFVQKKLANIDSKETEYNLNVENARQNLVKMAMDNASDVRNLELKYADKDISQATRFTTDILGSIVKMSPYIAVSAITGGVGGATLGSIAGSGTMYAQVYTDSMSKAINEGATREQATEYAHASAMIETGTEMLSGGIPGAPKGLLSSGIQGKIDDVVKVMVKDGTFRKFISTGVDVFGEGAEEALSEYLGSMALSIYTEDERSDEELTQDMIKAFIMGSVTSATMQMGKYGIIKAAEKFVAEKSTDVQTISLEQANDVMNRIALRTQVENFDGLSYKLEDLPKGNNGYIIDGKTIVLNRNQVEESGLIESALPHEMTHALEKVKGYDQLASFVVNLKAKTLGMDLAKLQQVYQEKFDEVHQQAIEMGDTSHQLEIATPDKMARELVAEFIKDNIASRPYKDAQGNIQYDSDGNIITYRNYDALLRLASNQPNMVNKIKKVIRSMIRKSQISEAIEFDQTQKADFLIMQEYLESLDGYLNTVLDNADKGLFATEQVQGLQFDTKVLSPNTEQGVKVIRAYESENEQYKGTLEDAQKLLDYSARKGLGFNEVQYEGGTLVRQNNVQLSLDQLKKNDIDVNEVKDVQLSKGQQDFFKDISEEAYDEKGNLKLWYHGSDQTFTVPFANKSFGEYRYGDDTVMFFTNREDVAKTYQSYKQPQKFDVNTLSGTIYQGYVNFKKPFIVEGNNKNWNDLNFIDINSFFNKKDATQEDKEYLNFMLENNILVGQKIDSEYTKSKIYNAYNLFNEILSNKDDFNKKVLISDKKIIDNLYNQTVNYDILFYKNKSIFDLMYDISDRINKYADFRSKNGLDNTNVLELAQEIKDFGFLTNKDSNIAMYQKGSTNTNDIVKSVLESNKLGLTDYDSILFKGITDVGFNTEESIEQINKMSQKKLSEKYTSDVLVTLGQGMFKDSSNLKPTSSPDIRYSLDNSLISQLNLSTLIPLIEQSKQSASDYINSLNIQSDNPNVIKYLETMSNFVRDYNPELRYDTIGNLTTQSQEDDFNLRENGKLKVYYYDENAINDNAISYGHFLTDNPIGLENPKQVYVKANLVDANGTELSQLDELYEDMTNSDILKQYGSEELLNRVKSELGIDGLQFEGSVMVFSKEQFKDTKIKSTYSEKALSSIKSVSFKKSGNNYIIRSRDFDNKEYTVVLDYEDTIQTFGNDFAKVILVNAKTQEQNYDFVDNIISKPSDKVKQGVFSQERDDHNNQLTEDIVKFNSESSIRQKDGTLKVMYHGSPNRFEEFSYLNLGTTGVQEGKGFYFIDNPLEANKYTNNEEGTIYEVYLNIKKPTNRNKMSISDEQLRKIVLDVHNYDDNGLLYNYADVDREGIESALDEAIDTIKSFADNDVDIIDTILNDSRIDTEQGLRIVNQYTGIDGYTLNTSDGMVSIAFFPEQIKSINNPNPTNDRRIQYSIELDSIKQQQTEQAKLNSTNNFSEARSILNDGTVSTSDSVPLDSVLLNPLYNQAIITKMPTKAQKEQLQAFYLDTLARSGDTVYLELHDGDRVAYLKYPVVSDLNVVNSDIAKFYNTNQQQEFFRESKARDEQGNLENVYHGTDNQNFFQFDDRDRYIFLSTNKEFARDVANQRMEENDTQGLGRIINAYVNVTKPFDPSNENDLSLFRDFMNEKYKEFEDEGEIFADIELKNGEVVRYRDYFDEMVDGIGLDNWKYLEIDDVYEFVKQNGYDGLVLYEDETKNYAVLNSNQIKEVTNLAPTLSPDIRYSIEDERIATRSFQESVLRTELSDKTSETIEKKIADGTFNYVVVEDKQSVDRAIAEIGEDVDKAYNKFKAKIDSGLRMTKDDLVIGQLLIKKLEKSRQTEKVVSLVQDVALLGTELGQQVQALHLIKRMSAEGKLMMMQKTLTRLQDSVNSSKDRNAPRVQLEIPKEYQEFFVEVGARTQELEEQLVQLGQTTEELKSIEREIDSLLLSNVGSEIDTLSRELSELRALEKEESRLVNLVEQLQNRASSLSSEDIDLLQEDARILREQINAKQGSLNEIKQKQAKLSRLESQLAKVQQGENLFLDYSIEENKKQIDEYQSRINEINKQKRKYANLESTLERLSGVDPNVIAELNAKVKVVRKAERLLKKLVKENERFTSKENVDDILDEVKDKIAEQLPVTWKDKLDAWRYMSMLGNLRTNVRNVLGNAFVMPMTFSRDILSVGLQQFLPQEQRTRVLRASKEAENFALNDYLTVGKDIMEGTQKYDMKTDIERKRTIFKNRLLEGFREGTFKALEVGDTVFTKKHYITQMAKYLTAQNIDLNTITDEQLENARDFAIKEAEKNTFKQASDLANALNRIERKGGVAGTIVKAVIPFKKTPINILKMGLEYSPLGVLNGIKKIAFDVKSGKVTASQAIDTLSAGLTGTGIALLGATLYGMGFIEIGADDDETKRVYNYKNSLGRQRYSIQIGEGSYSIDWIAPAIMPFIMGAEMMRAFESDTEASLLDSLYDATLDIFDPVFELTMLQGVTDTLQSYSGSGAAMFGETLTTMGSNYINQFVPTLLGQIARTVDPIQRSTLPDAKGSLSSTLETTFRKLGNKIPYVSMMNAPVVDVKGQPISSDENPFMRAFMNLFSPGYYKTDNTTEIDQEILRLYELTENTNVLPKATPKSFQFGGETYKLGNKEYSDFGITMGEESYNLLGKLTRYDLDDETKIKVMDNLYDYAYQLAKDKYLRTQGLENDDASYKKVIEAELKGIPTLDYLIAKYAYSTMSGEDKKETFQKFLDENGFDDDLMEIVGGYKPSSSKLKTKGLKKLK